MTARLLMLAKARPFMLARTRFFKLALLVLLGSAAFAQDAGFSLENTLVSLRATPDWQIATLTYQNAQRNLETAQAAAGINLSAGGNYNLTQPTDTTLSGNSAASLSVTASANVLPWSAANDGIRTAMRAFERAALDLRDTRNSLTLTTLSTYFGTRTSSLDVEVATANQKLAEAQVRVADLKYKNGQITLTDLLTAQQTLATAQSTLLTAQNTLRINLANLGVPDGTKLTTAPVELELPEGTPEALARAALGRRADVLKAISRVQDAEDTLNNAQRDRFLPNASLSLGYGQLTQGGLGSPSLQTSLNFLSGTASLTGTIPLNDNSKSTTGTGVSVSISANIPVLAPSTDARINAAQTGLEAAKASLESTRRAAALDVAQRHSDVMTAKARIKVSQSTLETARKTLETATARNQSGLNTAIDLQQATVNLAQAQRDLENATATAMIAVYRLQNAIGTFKLVPQGAAE